jgi:hypothetical protein
VNVGGRLRHDRRHHRHRDAAPRRFGDVDVVGRDGHRAYRTQFWIGCQHRAVDAVVQQWAENVTALGGGDQLILADNLA